MDLTIPPEVVALAKAGATPAAVKAVESLAGRVARSIGASISKQAREVVLNLKTNFGPHLESTYDKCTKIKTLVNLDEPVDLLSQYVPLRFRCQSTTFDDVGTLDQIRERKRVIISGTGGGGKTIFTKYLWISFFENPKGQIPVFIELRRLNEIAISDDSLLTLVYHTIVASHANVPREVFDYGVSSGLFVFILDGFDEVAVERKSNVERQILSLARNNPDCIVVVSGRPDETFDSWQAFSNFRVSPLDQAQVVSLIEKLNFDKATKKKFVARVKADLYVRHVSFLSTPLLATLMLLTFNQFADIPEKIHLFYEQAFETLFARHDAMKETFKRDMHSSLSIDVFKRYFSYFCLVSYYDEKFEFTDAEMKEYLRKGAKIEGVELDVDAFLKDLRESVCVIQRDGLNLVFTHRSFQEFFAAYCLSRLPKKHFKMLVGSIARRQSDSVLQMLHDMNEERLETEYILPAIDEFLKKFNADPEEAFLYRFCSSNPKAILSIAYERSPKRLMISYGAQTPILGVCRSLFAKPSLEETAKMTGRYRRQDQVAMKPLSKSLAKLSKLRSAKMVVEISSDGLALISVPAHGEHSESTIKANWFEKTGFAEYARSEVNLVLEVKEKLTKKSGLRDFTIDQIFGADQR